MLDPRLDDDSIFEFRKKEWNNDKIKQFIEDLFKNIELIDGWKFVSCDWKTDNKSKQNNPTVLSSSITDTTGQSVTLNPDTGIISINSVIPPTKKKKTHQLSRKEELKKNITKTLIVKIKNAAEKEFKYPIQIPQLIESQYFYIGGNLKTPLFQLYDMPVIFRLTDKGYYLNLKTNVLSCIVNLNRNDNYTVSVFGKVAPLCELICGFHSKDELDNFYNSLPNADDNYMLAKIKTGCDQIYEDYPKQSKLMEKIGESFVDSPNADKEKKGEIVIFSLKTAQQIDTSTVKFFKTSSIFFEILNAIYEGTRSDSDYKNKRIRFFEYVLSPLIRKVYNMIVTIRKNKKIKFQIPQPIVVDNCNVSEIVHINYPMNPTGELASLLQFSLTGPGGFKKEMVPTHLRNLDDSQLGRVCPADTPDRAGCGVVENLVPSVRINDDGTFSDETSSIVCSFPISLTPFMCNDDQTRLQMASNQTKQSILLKKSEKPMVRSGMEPAYLDKTTFLHRAKDEGVVAYLDNTFMIVRYVDDTSQVFNIRYREMNTSTIDYLVPMKKQGEYFNKNEILVQSRFLKDGELSLGQNLLTGITIWKGYNYEDGIVISESVSKERFTSIHSVDLSYTLSNDDVLLNLNKLGDSYVPIPKINQVFRKGDVYAKIKTIRNEEGMIEVINNESQDLYVPCDCKIVSIEIYPNEWNHQLSEYSDFISKLANAQTKKLENLKHVLKNYMTDEDIDTLITINYLTKLDCKSQKGRYFEKGKRINGVQIKIKAIYEEQIGVGDKISNRHGGKGVLAKIVPDDQMPVLEDGRRLDVIISPLGIISRMNVGQLFELAISECLNNLKKELLTMDDKKAIKNKISQFYDIISKEVVEKFNNNWCKDRIMNEFENNIESNGLEYAINNLYVIIPVFTSIHPKDLDKLVKFTNSKYRFDVFDPELNKNFHNKIAAGYMYFNKLQHRAQDKLSSRSIGPYQKNTLIPLGGKRKKGGLRIGEMEIWSLFAHGANNAVKDFMTVHSDSPGLKNKALSKILQNPDLVLSDNSDEKPQSLLLFQQYLKSIGLDLVY